MTTYVRPLLQTGPARPDGALVLAQGWCWFTHLEVMERGRPPLVVPVQNAPPEALAPLTDPRAPLAGVTWSAPRLMGILNVTPDSFSDGGLFADPADAMAQARVLAQSASILDIGGESTRPGAEQVPQDVEIKRTAPVIASIRAAKLGTPISIDTRKAEVAQAALDAGAGMINDVSALSFDPQLAAVAVQSNAPICLMHAQGTPEVMQQDPRYSDVVLDVFDHLAERVAIAVAAGIAPDRIIVDPGIGFGKTLEHNLALLERLSLFHSLGCVVLLGASRKRFIGTLTGVAEARARMPGSLAVALHGATQGIQILRVHDTVETKQALSIWQPLTPGVKE